MAQHIKRQVQDRYVIGPVVESSFWDGERAGMQSAHGPCEFVALLCEKLTLTNDPRVRENSTGVHPGYRHARSRLAEQIRQAPHKKRPIPTTESRLP